MTDGEYHQLGYLSMKRIFQYLQETGKHFDSEQWKAAEFENRSKTDKEILRNASKVSDLSESEAIFQYEDGVAKAIKHYFQFKRRTHLAG